MNDTVSPSTPQNGAKKWLIGAALALILGAGSFGAGFFQGRGALETQRAGFERQLSDAQTRLTQSGELLARTRNRERLGQARAALLRAAIDLERRNFGVASGRMREASAALQGIKGAELQTEIETLRREIAALDLTVAADVGVQRNRVVEFAARLERLTPPQNNEPAAADP